MNIYKQRNTKIATLIIVGLMMFDIIINYISSQGTFTPWIASFMSASGEGHIAQVTLWYFTPLIVLLLITEIGFDRKVSGLLNIELMRNKHAPIMLLLKTTIISTTIFVTAIVLNFVFTLIVFHGQTFDKSLTEIANSETNMAILGLKWQVTNPYITLVFYSLINIIYWISITIFTYGIGLIVNKKIELYVVSLVIYYIVLMTINPLICIQPFTEFSFSDVALRFLLAIIVFTGIGVTAVYVYLKGEQL